jgi:hypothetical protein
MLQVALIIPLVLFLVLGRATRSSWRLQLALVFLPPLIAMLLLLAGEVVVFDHVGPILSVGDLGALVASFFLLMLPESIYPCGTCVAALAMIGWAIFGRAWSLPSPHPNKRILLGLSLGAAVGLLFAILMFAAYASPQFLEFMQSRDRPPPLVLPMSFLTGAIDGGLIAMFSSNGFRPKPFDRVAQTVPT